MIQRILIVSPAVEIRIFLSSVFRESGYDVHSLASPAEGLEHMASGEGPPDLVLLDAGEKDLPSRRFGPLDTLVDAHPGLTTLLLTAGGAKDRDRARTLGAFGALARRDCVQGEGPVSVKAVLALARAVDEASQQRAGGRSVEQTLAYYEEYFRRKYRPVGRSEALQAIMAQARRLAAIPRPVLIRGERGTGKELVAGAIHFMGPRAKAPFVTVNCAAFQGGLLESEMFGHEKGAFTGADRRKIGRFELADGGTLFLDEVGNMSLEFQAKVLRVIEYQEFERVAGTEKIQVDVRVIAATNADLEARIRDGAFRADLYDRLSFAVLEVPPLRDRPEDVEVLVEAFAHRIAEEVPGIVPRPFAREVMRRFREYGWPGNVRELKNVVERLTCKEGDGAITAADLPPEILAHPRDPQTFNERVDAFQVQLLLEALHKAGRSQKKAAATLGLSYDQFRHMVRKFDLLQKLEGDAEA